MFTFLGRITAAHPWMICFGWVVIGASLSWIAPNWDSKAQDDDIHFLPARCDSVRGYQLLEKAFPQDVYASRAIITVERKERKLNEADYAFVDLLVSDFERFKNEHSELQIGKISSHDDPFIGKRLISGDGQCTLIQVSLPTPFLAAQTQTTVDRLDQVLRDRLKRTTANTPTVLMSGPAGIGRDLNHAGNNSLDTTTLATVILVVVILLLVYRAPLLALVPLLTIGTSVWVALKLLALLTLIPGVYLVNVSKVFAVVLLYGAGTDYCLFLISRYREELMNGNTLPISVSLSVRAVGGALAASAGTVICGLGLMGCAEFAKVRCAGPAIALSLVVALAASLTLTPALLHLLGRAVFWPRGMPRKQFIQPQNELWARISKVVVTRPALVWSISLALLLPLAFLGLRLKQNYRPTGELSPSCQSIKGLDVIQKHFVPGEVGPITVLLTSTNDWDKGGRELISLASRSLAHLDNVAEVRSLTQPLGKALPEAPRPQPPWMRPTRKKGIFDSISQAIKLDSLDGPAGKVIREHFNSKVLSDDPEVATSYVTRIDVIMKSDPFSSKSIATLGVVQAWLRDEMPQAPGALADVGWECYGVTVNARDLSQISESDRHRVNLLVLGAIFLILLVLVRHLWLAAYLLVTVLISYFATLGATSLGGILFTGHPYTEVDWRVPFFLFTILIAVGEDYNIFLITRALKERKRHGDVEGMRRALARTGGTITSCGLIMAGTFATLMLAGLGTLIQAGFALAFGVLLDTFLVRPFLVPAFTVLVWRKGEVEPEPGHEEKLAAMPKLLHRMARKQAKVSVRRQAS